jgi:dienelactone hydrolase
MKTTSRISAALGFVIMFALQAASAEAAIRTQYIEYMHGSTALKGYLAYDDAISGRRPAVLLLHSRSGLQGSNLENAQMVARMGYVVFAADVFGKDVIPKTVPEMTKLTDIYNKDRQLMRARARAGFDVLAKHPMVDPSKMALIGYCFGGTVAIELAETGVPVVGTIAVHGSFRNFTPEDARHIKGSVLILHGAEDEVAPLEEVNKLVADLRAAKVPFELQLYSGSSHGFDNPQNSHEERADREYRRSIVRFFKEIFRVGT